MHLKSITILLLLWFLSEKNPAQQSQTILIAGEIQSEKTLTWADILAQKSQEIGDFPITNHLGEPRGVLQSAKGVPVGSLLKELEYNTPSPKQLSEFYFVFEASDGYKVVFSWNELFNNPLGEQVYLITSSNGQSLQEMEDSLLLISKTDVRTGRRHVKNLEKIHVKRVSP